MAECPTNATSVQARTSKSVYEGLYEGQKNADYAKEAAESK
jgi:hypothetical protein